MAGGTFHDRIEELIESVGDGHLTGTVEVDQLYAAIQHESLSFKHPRGGRAKYLSGPLLENSYTYVQEWAQSLLTGKLKEAMIKSMEDLSKEVYDRAPREFNDLRLSAHPIVMDGDMKAYDRPPFRARLSDEELRAKGQLRSGRGRDTTNGDRNV